MGQLACESQPNWAFESKEWKHVTVVGGEWVKGETVVLVELGWIGRGSQMLLIDDLSELLEERHIP